MNQAIVATVVAAIGVVSIAGAQAQSLEQALVSAYLTNPQLEAQRAALRATDELVPQALSGWRPSVIAEGDTIFNDTERSGPRSNSDTFTTLQSSLAVDQEIYSGGETVANTRRAERLVRVERAQLMVVEQNVLLEAVTVYTDLLAARAVLDFANGNEGRLRRQLQATQDRFDVGEVTRTDVAQSDARLSGAIADRIEAEGAVSGAIASYRRVINQEPAGLVVPPPLSLLPDTEEEAQVLAEDLNPSIAAAQYNLSAARADVDVAESSLLPRLSVRGELAYARDPNEVLDWRRDASIGANLRVPLYQGGGEYARVRQTKQTVRQRRDDIEDTLRAVRDEVTTSWETLLTATSRIESIGAQVRANEIAVEGSRQEALVGQRTTLDVLDQESDLFQSQVDLVRARRDQIIASYRLKAAIGQLTPGGIDLPVQEYDAEAYYNDSRNRWIGLGEPRDGNR